MNIIFKYQTSGNLVYPLPTDIKWMVPEGPGKPKQEFSEFIRAGIGQ